MPTRSVDHALVRRLAETRDHVVHRRDLIALGVPEATIAYRTRAGGSWQRMLPGTFLLATGTPTREQQLRGALVYAGAGAVITGTEALRRQGVSCRSSGPDVHVLIDASRHRASRGYVRIERTTRMPPVVHHDAIPYAVVSRAALDAARRLQRLDDVRDLLAGVVQGRHASVQDLADELDQGSPRGRALATRVLAELAAGARSVAEANAMAFALWARLPAMEWNVPVVTRDGHLLAVPDAWLDDVAMAWEIDSFERHASPAAYESTLARRARLMAAGAVVFSCAPRQLDHDRAALRDHFLRAYEQARRRPRPPLRVDRDYFARP
jgi:hypothetical protein